MYVVEMLGFLADRTTHRAHKSMKMQKAGDVNMIV